MSMYVISITEPSLELSMDDVDGLPAQTTTTGEHYRELSQKCNCSDYNLRATTLLSHSIVSCLNSGDDQGQEAAARTIRLFRYLQQQAALVPVLAAEPGRLQALIGLMESKNSFLQAEAAAALGSLACGSECNQQAIVQEPSCTAALVALLHSRRTEVLRAALETMMTLAENSCEAAQAALYSVPGYLPTLLSLLHRNSNIHPGATTDIVRLVQLLVLHNPAHAAAELMKNRCIALLDALLEAPDAVVRQVARAVRSCLVMLDYCGGIPFAAIPHCIDALVAVLNSSSSSSSSSSSTQQSVAAAALHELACKQYRDRDAAANIVPQFLEKMMCALRSEVQAVQAAALDAIQCLTQNQFTDHDIVQHSRSLLYLTPMLLADNDTWRYAAACALCSLADVGPETCAAIVRAPVLCGWKDCVWGLVRMIGGDRPPHLQAAAAKSLGVLVAGSKDRQDTLLATFGCVYRLVALLGSTDQAVQLAGLGALTSLAAGNDKAVILIKSQQGLEFAGHLWRLQCGGPGPVRRAALNAERTIRLRISKAPPQSASWQDSILKVFLQFTRCATCQQSCFSTREASYAALCT